MGSDGNGRQLRLGSASPGNTSSATRIIMLVNILFVMFVYPSSHTARCCEIRLGFGLCCRRKPPQPLKSTFAIRLLKQKSSKSTTRGSHSHSTGAEPPTPEPPAQTPHQHFGLQLHPKHPRANFCWNLQPFPGACHLGLNAEADGVSLGAGWVAHVVSEVLRQGGEGGEDPTGQWISLG